MKSGVFSFTLFLHLHFFGSKCNEVSAALFWASPVLPERGSAPTGVDRNKEAEAIFEAGTLFVRHVKQKLNL